MASETQPISSARFAEALKDLPSSSLALKVLELRSSIAHLDYSNAELRPFAEGITPTLDQQGNLNAAGQPDQDCKDAIAENEAVIARMQERIELIHAEVESRGLNWREFQGTADGPAAEAQNTENNATRDETSAATTNAVNGHGPNAEPEHEAWRDGTFQTGTIRGGEELLRELLNRIPPEDGVDGEQDPDGGMHL